MISFIEVTKRSLQGPRVDSEAFDLEVDQKLRETLKNYDNIKYNPKTPIPNDDKMADAVFQAGIEFYEKIGTHCVDSGRVIKFTRKEILEALHEAPGATVFGEGKDAKVLTARLPESAELPWCWIGAAGAIVRDEHVLAALIEGYGMNPRGNSITCPAIRKINGMEIVVATPLELLGCMQATKQAREALRKAGRPGMPIMNNIASAVTDTAKIAASQFGLRPTDGWLIGSLSEFKINYQRLNEIMYVLNLGGRVVSETSPVLGGYCGGPEGVAVANVAYHLQALMVQRGSCQLTFPIHLKYSSNSARNVLWAISLSNQAISRNSKFPFFIPGILAAGPGTEMVFRENAAHFITTTVSGGNIEAVGVGKSVHTDHQTPWECKFSTEIVHAVTGMKRDRACEIVDDLLKKYEEDLPTAPIGKRFQDLFDVETLEPKPEYADLYDKMRDEMKGYGLKFVE